MHGDARSPIGARHQRDCAKRYPRHLATFLGAGRLLITLPVGRQPWRGGDYLDWMGSLCRHSSPGYGKPRTGPFHTERCVPFRPERDDRSSLLPIGVRDSVVRPRSTGIAPAYGHGTVPEVPGEEHRRHSNVYVKSKHLSANDVLRGVRHHHRFGIDQHPRAVGLDDQLSWLDDQRLNVFTSYDYELGRLHRGLGISFLALVLFAPRRPFADRDGITRAHTGRVDAPPVLRQGTLRLRRPSGSRGRGARALPISLIADLLAAIQIDLFRLVSLPSEALRWFHCGNGSLGRREMQRRCWPRERRSNDHEHIHTDHGA